MCVPVSTLLRSSFEMWKRGCTWTLRFKYLQVITLVFTPFVRYYLGLILYVAKMFFNECLSFCENRTFLKLYFLGCNRVTLFSGSLVLTSEKCYWFSLHFLHLKKKQKKPVTSGVQDQPGQPHFWGGKTPQNHSCNCLLLRTIGSLFSKVEIALFHPDYVYLKFQIIYKAVKSKQKLPVLVPPKNNFTECLIIYCGARSSVGHWELW